jgi:hypothetical protein
VELVWEESKKTEKGTLQICARGREGNKTFEGCVVYGNADGVAKALEGKGDPRIQSLLRRKWDPMVKVE